jgi:hypothetical protein
MKKEFVNPAICYLLDHMAEEKWEDLSKLDHYYSFFNLIHDVIYVAEMTSTFSAGRDRTKIEEMEKTIKGNIRNVHHQSNAMLATGIGLTCRYSTSPKLLYLWM